MAGKKANLQLVDGVGDGRLYTLDGIRPDVIVGVRVAAKDARVDVIRAGGERSAATSPDAVAAILGECGVPLATEVDAVESGD